MLAALFTDFLSWQSFYYVIALGLVLFASPFLNQRKAQFMRAKSPLLYLKQLKDPLVLKLYGAVFCMFFCFAALLNYLPFILQDSFAITNTRNRTGLQRLFAWCT